MKSAKAPYAKHVKYYPVVLEFFYADNPDVAIPKGFEDVAKTVANMTNHVNKIKETLSLLTDFSNYHFFQQHGTDQPAE